MQTKLAPETISYEDFKTYRSVYDLEKKKLPEKFEGLQELRYKDVPEVVAQRKKDGEAFLEKTEVQSLVEWKLKFGTYRPSLASLVASNPVEEVRKTTSSAFELMSDNPDPSKAISTLSKLKGVGPATASLLLSCYDPVTIPFFSDELFRWLHWQTDISGTVKKRKSKGIEENRSANRKIGYTAKEYASIYEKTTTLRERLCKESGETITAADIEKAAYKISQSAQDEKASGSIGVEPDAPVETKDLCPPSPKRRKKKTPEPREPMPSTKCLQKGPRGSPTYDELGYELGYDYIVQCSGRPRPVSKRGQERLEQKQKDSERKAEIMGRRYNGIEETAWDDRVARDLGKAYHEVGMEEYEDWAKKGFTIEEGEFENPSEEEKERLKKLMIGCALRKGSKHR
ncbi:MAG: hypothetical protein Q9166_005529 [cf. Caloplaca sp. 2 TL-2023]